MDRAALIAAAKAKYEREQLIAAARAKAAAEASTPTVDEDAPISKADRAVVMNFGNSPEAQAAYLKQQYPDAAVKVVDGEVAIKLPGETAFKRLDASSLTGRDLLDLPYDIAAGIAQGAATAGGAAAGAVGGPVGALAGGAAASGASGAGLEALRQRLGAALGIPQEVSPRDVAMSGAIGTAAPLVFGAGNKAARGALETTYDFTKQRVFPKLGELTSGVKADVIRAYAKNMNKVDDLEAGGITKYADDLTEKVQNSLSAAKKKAGEELARVMKEAKTPVDVATAKANWQAKINQAGATAVTEADDKYVAQMEALKKEYLDKLPDLIDGAKAMDVQQKLKDAAKFDMTADTSKKYAQTEGARAAYSDVNKAMAEATGGLSTAAKKNYADQIEIEDLLSNAFSTPQKTYSTVTGLNAKSKKVMAEKLKELAKNEPVEAGTNITRTPLLDIGNEIEVLQAYNAFADPSMVPVSLQGATSTSRSIPLSIGGASIGSLLGYKLGGGYAGAALGGLAGAKLGNYAGSPAMMKRAIKSTRAAEKLARRLQPEFGAGLLASPAAAQSIPLLLQRPDEDEQY